MEQKPSTEQLGARNKYYAKQTLGSASEMMKPKIRGKILITGILTFLFFVAFLASLFLHTTLLTISCGALAFISFIVMIRL